MQVDLTRVKPLSFAISQQNFERVEILKGQHNANRSRILNAAIGLGLEQLEQAAGNKKPALN